MTSKKKFRISVERIRTESAYIEVTVDLDELEEWSGNDDPDTEEVIEFLESDRFWPDNIESYLDAVEWKHQPSFDQIELMVP